MYRIFDKTIIIRLLWILRIISLQIFWNFELSEGTEIADFQDKKSYRKVNEIYKSNEYSAFQNMGHPPTTGFSQFGFFNSHPRRRFSNSWRDFFEDFFRPLSPLVVYVGCGCPHTPFKIQTWFTYGPVHRYTEPECIINCIIVLINGVHFLRCLWHLNWARGW